MFVRGQAPSDELANLAENGDPSLLVEYYTSNNEGVNSVTSFSEGAPFFGGTIFQIEVDVTEEFPLVTIGAMTINTNDGFVSLNGVHLYDGQVIDVEGLDAGSEENNELCEAVPGPACASINTDNIRSGNGEGFVHVHRGFFGIGDLNRTDFDWRTPMMRVTVSF